MTPEEKKAYNAAYYARNRAKILADQRRRYLANIEAERERGRLKSEKMRQIDPSGERARVAAAHKGRIRSSVERVNRERLRSGFPHVHAISQETFLGFPIVCNNFSACTNHPVCAEWRWANPKDALGRAGRRYAGPRGPRKRITA